jgi:hypothetical protein
MPGLTALPEFADLVPHILVQAYYDAHQHSRYRIELRDSTPFEVRLKALRLTMPCVACGRDIHPFRERQRAAKAGSSQAQAVYIAAACSPEVRPGCSRGNAARDEYIRIREAVAAWRRGYGEALIQNAPDGRAGAAPLSQA